MAHHVIGALAGLTARFEGAAATRTCCGYTVAVITGAGELRCENCGTRRGAIGSATAKTLESIIQKFGRPDAPIVFRRTA
jgi:hypothetical protein